MNQIKKTIKNIHVGKRIQDPVLKVLWQMPHDRRRDLVKTLSPTYLDAYEELRQMPLETEYGLAPFDKHECIFIHVPKCAGLSITNALFGTSVGTHTAIKTFQLIYDKSDFDRYFKFGFVRNPWSRVVSAYTFLRKGGLTADDKQWASDNLDAFSDFDTFIKGWLTPKNANSWQHFKPQYRFLTDPSGKIPLDFIGRFENLAEDFNYVAKKLNSDATLPHINKTSRTSTPQKADFRTLYTEESRDIVAHVYKKDIELFNYSFDTP